MSIVKKIRFRIDRLIGKFRLRCEILELNSLIKYYLWNLTGYRNTIQVRVNGFPRPIFIRKGNEIDLAVIKYVFFQKFHLPPAGFTMPDNPLILDLGSNIGLTINHFKRLYPGSRILGFEMDSDNYSLAMKNCTDLPNVRIFHNAVWFESSKVLYDKSKRTDAYKVESNGDAGNSVNIQSITIDDIIKQNALHKIDFLKMDIEGAESEIFKSGNLEWLSKVKSLNIEFHDLSDEELNSKINLLKERGFNAWKDDNHWCLIKAYRG